MALKGLHSLQLNMQVDVINLQDVRQAFAQCPQLAFRFVRQGMNRYAARFRKGFIAERMRGRPGIHWREKASIKGNVQAKARAFGAERLENLQFVAKISALLVAHEEGITIRPDKRKMLAIPLEKGLPHKTSGAPGAPLFVFRSPHGTDKRPMLAMKDAMGIVHPLYVLVPQVKLPGRLGFVKYWDAHKQDLIDTIDKDLGRALAVAFERSVKRLSQQLMAA